MSDANSSKPSKVIEALPFDIAVATLDQPELVNKAAIVSCVETATATSLIEAMSADQQADVFRDLPDTERARLLPALDPASRKGLELLLAYAPDTAGGIMTTVSLRELILAKADSPVLDACAHREPIAVHATASREEVARLLSKYNLIAIPVVDDAHAPRSPAPSFCPCSSRS